MTVVLITIGFSFVLALVLGVALGFFREKFAVARDPLIDIVRAALPGANCGGCGFPGCDGYAEAAASKAAPPNRCTAGGSATAEAVAKIVGVEAAAEDTVAVLLCRGAHEYAPAKGEYVGVATCRSAKIATGGTKLCVYGCMGFGDCTRACKFEAIVMGDDGLPKVDYDKCTGCGMCSEACPQNIIGRVTRGKQGAIVLCSNRNPVKTRVIKTCKVGCIKCEACVRACPVQCITMKDGVPVVDYAVCTSCGTCVDKCPTKCFKLLQADVY